MFYSSTSSAWLSLTISRATPGAEGSRSVFCSLSIRFAPTLVSPSLLVRGTPVVAYSELFDLASQLFESEQGGWQLQLGFFWSI